MKKKQVKANPKSVEILISKSYTKTKVLIFIFALISAILFVTSICFCVCDFTKSTKIMFEYIGKAAGNNGETIVITLVGEILLGMQLGLLGVLSICCFVLIGLKNYLQENVYIRGLKNGKLISSKEELVNAVGKSRDRRQLTEVLEMEKQAAAEERIQLIQATNALLDQDIAEQEHKRDLMRKLTEQNSINNLIDMFLHNEKYRDV